jgi:lysophospholipase L1-like esterase
VASAATPPVRTSVKLLALGVTLFLAFLGMEVTLRIFSQVNRRPGQDLADWDPLKTRIEPFGAYGYRQRPGETYQYPNGTAAHSNGRGYRGPEVAIPKPPGVFRIILLGGSTTHGWGVDDGQSIDACLRAELQRRYPGRAFEVVNLGFDGYDSYQDRERFRVDGVPLAPDAVIVNSGINDVRNSRYQLKGDPDPRTLIWESDLLRMRGDARRGHPSAWSELKHYSYVIRLPGYLWARLAAEARGDVATDTTNPGAADLFQRHVQDVVDSSRALGAVVVLSTPPSSLLRKYPPDATSTINYWVRNAALTQAYRDTLTARLEAVAGQPYGPGPAVLYVRHDLPVGEFIDDAHLTPEGNRQLAIDFADALMPALSQAEAGPHRVAN